MLATFNYLDFVPQIVPQKMSGTITYNIRLHYKPRKDGTSALYLDAYQDGSRKKVPLNLSVPKKMFDGNKQRIKKSFKHASDYNLLIEKLFSDINDIEVNYRLSESELTLDKLLGHLLNPGLRINFVAFYENLLDDQLDKEIIQYSTFKQQRSTLNKIKDFQNPVLFSDIDEDWLADWQSHLKKKYKNSKNTIAIATKNFKKYLNAANTKGIKTKLKPIEVKVKTYKSNFTFLLPNEVKALHELYIKTQAQDWKHILKRYLFSCFTGLRLGDIETITKDNFIGDVLVFHAKKTGKLQRVKLNKTASELIDLPLVFEGDYSEQYINRELKHIAKACGIIKRLYYHSSRHTFATNFLLAGGSLRNLQKILGHSKIATTEVYLHVAESYMNKEIDLLDGIIN